jgi:UDP:flavonoid glycosyltransferase YjiC (YdhE family)
VLSNATYRNNARKLQEAIAEANGLSVAGDLVEESLGVTETAAKEVYRDASLVCD